MYRILVVNDDGIQSHGLSCLVEALGKIADVYVVAPKEQQSGMSMSITFLEEVFVEERELKGAVGAYELNGTPSDCARLGIELLEEEGITPDFVISGINLGHNLGTAIYYSGTISAAKEAAIHGIRSIALSVESNEGRYFDYLLGMLPQLIELSAGLDPAVVLSANAPDLPSWEVKGVVAAPPAPCGYGREYLFTKRDSGGYQMTGRPGRRDERRLYDFDWLDKGYVVLSPITTDLNDPAALMKLQGQTVQTDCLTVVIDAQEGVLGRARKTDAFIRNTEKLVHAVTRMGKPLLMTESYDRGEIIPQLNGYIKDAELVRHIHPDVWTSPDMERLVSAADCSKVLIAGAYTNVELLQTVPGFLKRGIEVIIAEDCCTAADRLGHDLAIGMMKESGCCISTLETEVMRLAGSCSRQVLDAVKNILLT